MISTLNNLDGQLQDSFEKIDQLEVWAFHKKEA